MVNNWTINDVLSFQIPSGMTISPDGGQVVYSLRTHNEEKGTYEYKLWSVRENQREPLQLTRGESQDTDPKISPDGAWLGFLTDRKSSSVDDDSEVPEGQLYVLPMAGGESMLASEELGEIYDFAFAPDGSGVYVIADAKETPYETYLRERAEEDKRDVVHEERPFRAKRICFISLPKLEVETLYDHDFGLQQIRVSPSGEFLVFVTNYTGLANDMDKCDLWLLQKDEAEQFQPQPLVQRKGACVQPSISPDGKTIAFAAPRGLFAEHSQSDLWVVDIASGTRLNVTDEIGFVGDVQDLAFCRDNTVVAAVEQALYAPLVVFERREDQWTVRLLTNETAIAREFVVAEQANVVACLAETPLQPEDVLVGALEEGCKWKTWTDLHASRKQLPRGRVQPFRWTAADGWPMEGVLVLPNRETAGEGPYPMIVDIHGGPAWHTTLSFNHYLNYHWIASLGYAVFSPNYRGGIGYGHDYIQGNAGDLGGKDYLDIMAGVDAVVALDDIDASRLGLIGGSYGGYMTNWIIGRDHRFQAAVSEFGIWSLFTDFGCSSQRVWEMMYLGSYWENERLYLERSPSRYVQNIETPVLIVHGDADDNTFLANSREMYNSLVQAGKQVEFVHYPREGHGVREPRHRADELERIRAWFGHYIPAAGSSTSVPLRSSRDVEMLGVRVCVKEARETDVYATYGEDYEQVVEVTIHMEPLENRQKSEIVLHADDPAVSDIRLWLSSSGEHQRPSIFPAQYGKPMAVAANGYVISGDFCLHVAHPTSVKLLFDGEVLQVAKLSDMHIGLADASFQLSV